jgi:hypothetical protein
MMILWGIRFFLFGISESPKYLMIRGHDSRAVEVIHKVAAYNGVTSSLKLEHLEQAGMLPAKFSGEKVEARMDTSAFGTIKRRLNNFSPGRVKSLFATRKLALSTSLLMVLWGEYFI